MSEQQQRPKCETDNCRHRLMKYCQGQGLDIGCSFGRITTNAIGIDLYSPFADMKADARDLSMFPSEHFDFVYSAHLLEEIENTEATLKEWLRVLKPGGYIALYQADREYYYPLDDPRCNKSHKHHFLWEDLWMIFEKIGGVKLIHHARYGMDPYNEWSFELVVQKTGLPKMIINENDKENGISILIPTLNRPTGLETFARSVNETTKYPETVEILFGIHEDDQKSIEKIEELLPQLKIKIRPEIIDKFKDGRPHLAFLWNQLYKRATYPIVGYFGDDVEFKTPGWDEEIRNEFRKDKEILVSCNDVHVHRGKTATLFFTHKNIHEKAGFYLPPQFRRWYHDTFWDTVYKAVGKLHYREDIITEHFSPDKFKERADEVYNRMESLKQEDKIIWNTKETGEEINRCISIFRNKIQTVSPKPEKKIISFSLWGNDPKYLRGAEENIRLQKEFYPDWICRFYLDETVPKDFVEKLKSLNTEIIEKIKSTGYQGLFWRFEPGFEKGIERFIVRDCDSRLNAREADAVKEWEDSGLPFHTMRDHKFHDVPILGAMWGAKSFFLPNFKELYNNYLNQLSLNPAIIKRDKFFYYDQIFLRDIIWPKIKNNCIAHDDWDRFMGNIKSFKIKLPEGQFVGQQFDENDNPILI